MPDTSDEGDREPMTDAGRTRAPWAPPPGPASADSAPRLVEPDEHVSAQPVGFSSDADGARSELQLGTDEFLDEPEPQPTERERWLQQLAGLGGRNPLLHFDDAPGTRIELSVTHPGGLAQFITGQTTLLSSLIRDEVALRGAKLAADAIVTKGAELIAARGIDAVHLGIAIAEWQHQGVDYRAPVLIRPLAIRRHGRDFDVRLRGEAVLNPAFARAMREHFGIVLDAAAFVRLAHDDGTFKPNAVIDRLRGLTSHLEWFNVRPRLVVSCFVEVAEPMRADAAGHHHPVLDALAGDADARNIIAGSRASSAILSADEREPATDVLLLDADAEQEQVIAEIAAGNSVVVKTLPGTGGTQTIVNALGELVRRDKRVLVVSPRRATVDDIAARFDSIGLPGVAVAPRSLRRDIVRSISRNEKARQPQMSEVDEALVRLRTVLLDYRRALSRPDPVLGISVLDCVTELSRLALLPAPPSTTSRLSRRAVERLAEGRQQVAETMVAAASLGEFKYGPGDSPWYGAQFTTGDEAARAHALAGSLHRESLPRLLDRAGAVIGATRMRPFESIAELGIYLRLLTDLRETLDKFQPTVFDRPLTELIAATAPRREAPEMPGTSRRRLKKLAREYQRPGVYIADLHSALTRIQQQRVLWQRYVASGTTPEVPTGIADLQVAYQQVVQDLALLDGPLGYREGDQLAELPLEQLRERLEELAAESDVLNNLQERTELMTTLRDLELDPLIDDLAARHVPDSQVAAELELAWWQSALESLLEADRALLGANTPVLDRLEADFRLVDEAHAAGSAQLLGWRLAEDWKLGIADWVDEAELLKRLLRRGELTAFDLQTNAPHLSRAVAPVWLASPYEVHDIADTMPFDTVILVDAGAITLAEAIGAIRRARQVVAFGDPVTQTPAPFTLALEQQGTADAEASVSHSGSPMHAQHAEEGDLDALGSGESAADVAAELHADSALARLGQVLPTLSLTRSYRAGGEDLAELVNRRFYAGRIQSLPWAGSFLGHGSLTLDYLDDGTGLPDPDSGAVESVDAEVDHVVDLVLHHAATKPNESLMVITASDRHAWRVQQALLSAVAERNDLIEFVLGDRPEPFQVLTVEQAVAQSRDRVIFSIGYGRTPHGRVLSDFGALGEPGGERLLAIAMTRARRHLKIVTCFKPDDIEEGRMRHGAIALAEILNEVSARSAEEPLPDDRDPLLVDLARRLEKRGLTVALGHRGKLGLVAAHGGRCIAIDTDSELHKHTLRESLRLRPEMLRRLGWHYARVHSFELFSDPDAVADRISETVGAPALQPAAPTSQTAGVSSPE
ncbi:AAA family ATPase [Ruicaihuangia caeni]|uniref:AAA family ATPase n=1 Tax=Ruicaihuangia caeni TaxID=3042517 RepID=A0AAW6T4P6_9MICO|nr:AAA family ATPase [Klugiella sp. YN-L-19]MDI2098795.1 AAA family ATPase [Klugiella sp. YN-L-19]